MDVFTRSCCPDASDEHFSESIRASTDENYVKKLNQLPSPLEVIEAKIISIKGYDPPENKHGKIDDTPFMKLLKLKVGAKVMVTYNINIGDSLVNGSTGTVAEIVKSNGSIQSILVLLDEG